VLVSLVACATTMLVGCGDSAPSSSNAFTAKPNAGASATPPKGAAQTGAAAAAGADAGLPPVALKAPEVTESDFVEGERNRDPFRSYATLFVEQAKRPMTNQREVLLDRYGIEELKLVAIVKSSDYPRAMLVDPTGRGWVVKRGDFLGRAETVRAGGSNGVDYQLNWRVDRVREGDLVLVREDPAQPTIPPAHRVLILHPESDKQARF
jgi:type IV pilus assembly protein PilP